MGFQQGLSGLNAAAKNLDVIGNNVANASTVGFKSRRRSSPTCMPIRCRRRRRQVGIGTKVAQVAQQFTQGNITLDQQSAGHRDQRQGILPHGQQRQPSYHPQRPVPARQDGFIVNPTGAKLTGYPADANGAC